MSPRFQARLAGVNALLTTPAGFAAAAVGALYAPDDAAATAHNILAHELLVRLAVVGDVVSLLYIVYTLLLFNLFRPVSRDISLLAVFFSLVGIGIGAINVMFELAPLVILQAGRPLSAFSTAQLQALALMFLKVPQPGLQPRAGPLRNLQPADRLSHLPVEVHATRARCPAGFRWFLLRDQQLHDLPRAWI